MASELSYESTEGPQARSFDEPASGWGGWIVFAATMLLLTGALNVIHGIVAVVNDDWVVFTNRADVYLDLTAWGWIHIVIGAVVFLAGLGLFSGNVLARTVGVAIAALSLVANFLYLPVYPLWSLVIITIDVLVIYALTAHGRALQ